ncbi:hypothetical protein NE237_031098 [Protea cynaroides]|uniref:Uncharacterized protein n=1 Tax=Protea cynaroides TaxID=273540 RepID=A0A9Q0L0W2_9MAGN|nr:hypothetical protein NE237_031098 [Protea cynaroides]
MESKLLAKKKRADDLALAQSRLITESTTEKACLEANLETLRVAKEETNKTIIELCQQAQIAEEKTKEDYDKAQELEVSKLGKISQAITEFKASNDLKSYVQLVPEMKSFRTKLCVTNRWVEDMGSRFVVKVQAWETDGLHNWAGREMIMSMLAISGALVRIGFDIHSLCDDVREVAKQEFNFSRYAFDVDATTDVEDEADSLDEHTLEEVPQALQIETTGDETALALVPMQVEASQVIGDEVVVLTAPGKAERETITKLLSKVKALRVQLSETTTHWDNLSVAIRQLEKPWAKQVKVLRCRAKRVKAIS